MANILDSHQIFCIKNNVNVPHSSLNWLVVTTTTYHLSGVLKMKAKLTQG